MVVVRKLDYLISLNFTFPFTFTLEFSKLVDWTPLLSGVCCVFSVAGYLHTLFHGLMDGWTDGRTDGRMEWRCALMLNDCSTPSELR